MQMDSQVEVNGGGNSGESFSKRGTKRNASDSNAASDIERFEKRLRMLSLRGPDKNGNDTSHLFTPVSNMHSKPTTPGLSNGSYAQPSSEHMHVDDTHDRVYIHDLDAELADVESDDGKERLIFLPDIEKYFSKLPQQVLAGGQEGNRELVLYNVPKSLSVDEGHDSVRKAIIEARQRAREKAVEEARHTNLDGPQDYKGYVGNSHGYLPAHVEEQTEHDPDAMDIG